MVYYPLPNDSGVLEFDPPPRPNDSIVEEYQPALELIVERSLDGRLVATWLTEDGFVLARVDAGTA